MTARLAKSANIPSRKELLAGPSMTAVPRAYKSLVASVRPTRRDPARDGDPLSPELPSTRFPSRALPSDLRPPSSTVPEHPRNATSAGADRNLPISRRRGPCHRPWVRLLPSHHGDHRTLNSCPAYGSKIAPSRASRSRSLIALERAIGCICEAICLLPWMLRGSFPI